MVIIRSFKSRCDAVDFYRVKMAADYCEVRRGLRSGVELDYREISGESEPVKAEGEVVRKYFEEHKFKEHSIHLLIPDSVVEIEDHSFSDFDSSRYIGRVSIGSGVKRIGAGAFYGLSLLEVEIPGNVEEIGSGAFCYSDTLKRIKLNEGLKRIGCNAFYNHKSCALELPSSLEEIGANALYGDFLRYLYMGENPNFKVVDGILYSGDMKKLLLVPVEHRGARLVYKRRVGKKFVIRDGIEEIGAYACRGLDYREVEIPDSVKVIGEGAFYNSMLERVELPDDIEEVGDQVFYGSSHLRSVGLPGSIKRFGDYAFCESRLVEIKVPEEVEEIGDSCFYSCWHLERIELPEGLRVLGNRVFSDCRKLRELWLPDSLEEIGDECFSECAIRRVYIPWRLEKLGEGVFSCCKELSELEWYGDYDEPYTVYDNVLYNGDMTELIYYPSCKEGEEFEVPETVKSIWSDAFGCNKYLKRVVMGDGVEEVGSSAFYRCKNLEGVRLSRSLKKISNYLFLMSGLKEIEIPGNVESIGCCAFKDCERLERVKFIDSNKDLRVGYESFIDSNLVSMELPKRLKRMVKDSFPSSISVPGGVEEMDLMEWVSVESESMNCEKVD